MKVLKILTETNEIQYFVKISNGLIITTNDILKATKYKNSFGAKIAKGHVKKWGHDNLILIEEFEEMSENLEDVNEVIKKEKNPNFMYAFFARYNPCGSDYLVCVHRIGISNKRLDEIAENLMNKSKDVHLIYVLVVPINVGFTYVPKKHAHKVWYKYSETKD